MITGKRKLPTKTECRRYYSDNPPKTHQLYQKYLAHGGNDRGHFGWWVAKEAPAFDAELWETFKASPHLWGVVYAEVAG